MLIQILSISVTEDLHKDFPMNANSVRTMKLDRQSMDHPIASPSGRARQLASVESMR
jgi:hypothetical protein